MNKINRANPKKIVIFSPHLDDAVLDACDHIGVWKSMGHEVEIVSVFTSFGGGVISGDVRNYSGIQSLTSDEFEQLRKNEDREAMRLLGVKWKHLNFVDGGFRVYKKALMYSNFNSLFSGKVSSLDSDISHRLKAVMTKYVSFDHVFVPLGIGNHIDHIIVRNVAENIFSKAILGYYIDYPYALFVKNWKIAHIVRLLRANKSVIPFREEKIKYLECYASQLPLLFKNVPKYPEILVNAKKGL